MNKRAFGALLIAVGVAASIALAVLITIGVLDYYNNYYNNGEVETTKITTPIPVRVTVDPNNGFVCYDNTSSIACYPLMYGVPPPEVSGYIQGRIGRVFDFIATPPPIPPTPAPSFLDGIN